DLSGSIEGAGGAGGLLAINFKTNAAQFLCFDGNGNAAGLVDSADGRSTANYEYGPFGEAIRETGTLSGECPIRFSTQYTDPGTGGFRYLYREYIPSEG